MKHRFIPDFDTCGTPFTYACNVGAATGSDAFLLKADRCNILFDAGLGCGGDGLVANLERELKGETLDYILLSHSHYDHAPGAAWCKKRWPELKVIATGKTASVFTKPSAIATMRHLDSVASREFGIASKEDLFDSLHVDVAIEDGDFYDMNGIPFRLISFPGHTRCSAGYYFEETKTLLSSETLGVYAGGENIATTFLIGHKIGADSLQKARKMDIQHMLIPHFGFIHSTKCREFLEYAVQCCDLLWDSVTSAIEKGSDKDALIKVVVDLFFADEQRDIQPEEAFVLNAGYVVDNIIKEYRERKNDDN